MKKRINRIYRIVVHIICCFIALLFITQYSNAQTYNDTICWVWVSDTIFMAEEGSDLSYNNDLNTLFSQNQVEYYEKALPFAKTQELLTIHEIRCNINQSIDDVIGALTLQFPNQFYDFSKFEVSDSAIVVYDPIDYMWTNGSLWHLEIIQADLAWDYTLGDPNVKIAVIDLDFDVTHPDLASEISPYYDPYEGTLFDCSPSHWHGTTVASFASAETTEQGGTAQGQLASVGFNTKIIGYNSPVSRQTFLAKALHASTVMQADVIVSCANGALYCTPSSSSGEELIVKEILDNGTVIVMAAGNGLGGHHCGPHSNYSAFYPFNPVYDERIIVVTSTDIDDNHQFYYSTGEGTHSHFSDVDICAPGYDMMGANPTDCDLNGWPYYHLYGGTSFSSPIVAGACALLKSINSDFTPGEIQYFIKATADPVTDEANYPGMLGAGRLNIGEAIEMAYNCTPIVITTNEAWNDDRIVVCGIEIKNGATLTITSNVLFSKRSQINIERGGKLVIDGGILSNLDNILWPGVQAWGDPTKPHTNESDHGVVELKNGAIIENAKVAVSTTRKDENGNLVYGYHGGIVKADQTTFQNNKRAVEIWPFDFTNKAAFKRCTFLTSEALPDNNNFEYFIIMSEVDGVKIQGCDFENTRPAADVYMDYRGYGIYSTESQYTVSSYEDSVNGNIDNYFGKLNYGIKALGLTSAMTPSIKACSLEYNRTGIYLGGITSASVLSNYFLVETFDAAYDQNIYCGLYLDNSTQYHIEDNFFEHNTATSQNEDHTIGITVNNSGEQNNMIYLNAFKTLDIGILAQNQNRSQSGDYGLLIKCNDFGDNNFNDPSLYDNTYDIAVTKYGDCDFPGLKEHQGSNASQDSPAGNLFSQASNGIPDSDYSNQDAIRLFYWQHDLNSEPRINLTYHIPVHVTKRQTYHIYVESLCCPPSFSSGGLNEIESAISGYQNDADSVGLLLTALVDGGSTHELEGDVILSTPPESYTVYNDLMMKSPYLTDTVMTEAVKKEDVLNEVMVKEILVANPQSAKSVELMYELVNRMNPLPDYMIAEIEQGNMLLSDKELMEVSKYSFLHSKAISINDLKRFYKTDSSGIAYRDSLIFYLESTNSIGAKYELAFEHFHNQDYNNTSSVLANIPAQFALSSEQNDLFQEYSDYFNTIISLKQSNNFFYNLDSNQLATLNLLTNNIYSFPGAYARNALIFNEQISYNEPYILPDSTLKAEEIEDIVNKPDFTYPKLNVYPNPASDYITVEYDLSSKTCNGYIDFINLEGKVIAREELYSESYSKIIPLNDEFKSGTYMCVLGCDGQSLETKKITIIR